MDTPSLTLEELLNTHTNLVAKEAEDKALVESVASLPVETLRDKLLTWVSLKMPDLWGLLDLSVRPPARCSDGVVRSLPDYIEYVTGKSFPDHVAELQSKVTGVVFGFQLLGPTLRIVVSKADTP